MSEVLVLNASPLANAGRANVVRARAPHHYQDRAMSNKLCLYKVNLYGLYKDKNMEL